jgi:hypothetical protein
MSNSEQMEWLLLTEAAHDLEVESQGTPAPIGEMQKRFPEEYEVARKLASGIAYSFAVTVLSTRQAEKISEMIHSEDEGLRAIQDVLNMQPVNALTLATLVRLERVRNAKKGAEMRHNKPGGSREKQEQIRAIWARGNFGSRDLCAEEESGALGMSTSAARKALRNTPEPPSRCK